MDNKVVQVPKKKYTPPALTKYGTVSELTQRVGHTGAADGARRRATRSRLP
jgi:hypothetical protein